MGIRARGRVGILQTEQQRKRPSCSATLQIAVIQPVNLAGPTESLAPAGQLHTLVVDRKKWHTKKNRVR